MMDLFVLILRPIFWFWIIAVPLVGLDLLPFADSILVWGMCLVSLFIKTLYYRKKGKFPCHTPSNMKGKLYWIDTLTKLIIHSVAFNVVIGSALGLIYTNHWGNLSEPYHAMIVDKQAMTVSGKTSINKRILFTVFSLDGYETISLPDDETSQQKQIGQELPLRKKCSIFGCLISTFGLYRNSMQNNLEK